MVQWNQIGTIAISWVLSPVPGGLAAGILFFAIKKFILHYNGAAEARIREIRVKRIELRTGLWFIGNEVIATIGTNLTEIHPASGFSAEVSAAGVVMAASAPGLPVSFTHILVGAVLGIGIVNRAANWGLMKPIALAWVITLPASAILSAVTFYILRTIF